MKTFINTAKIEYLVDEQIKTVYSNRLVLPVITRENFVSGEILCRKGCRRWSLTICRKQNGQCVFRLNGYISKGFYFQINRREQYILHFEGDSDSTLRLYNLPDCIAVNHFYQ